MLVTSLNPVSFHWMSIFLHFPCSLLRVLTSLLQFQKIGYDNAAAVAKLAHKEGSTLKVIISSILVILWLVCVLRDVNTISVCLCANFFYLIFVSVFLWRELFLWRENHILQDVVLQEAALKLQVLTSEEFDSLVVPEKMIGPSNWWRFSETPASPVKGIHCGSCNMLNN